MISAVLRVAYFPDSFHEINGVAHTSRHFEAFVRRRGLPFLCVRAGRRRPHLLTEGNLTTLELPRGPVSIGLDKDLRFDVAWLRHLGIIARTLRRFRPHIVHITGPSDIGIFGAILANHYHLPLAASWHTNVHEYAAKRSFWLLNRLSEPHSLVAARQIENYSLDASARFYSLARVLFAPNLDLCRLLEEKTGRPCHLMQRGVDTMLFSPEKRDRPRLSGSAADRDFVFGFVGRLSVEKNIALLAQIQQELESRNIRNFRFLIVGQGAEERWLRDRLPRAEFTGVLHGEALARAYANMDLFIFPSHTDTFGNVVLEALASGVPAIVTPDGGPRYIIRNGETGFVAPDANFSTIAARILTDSVLHAEMCIAARRHALTASWDSVFEKIYAAYEQTLSLQAVSHPWQDRAPEF